MAEIRGGNGRNLEPLWKGWQADPVTAVTFFRRKGRPSKQDAIPFLIAGKNSVRPAFEPILPGLSGHHTGDGIDAIAGNPPPAEKALPAFPQGFAHDIIGSKGGQKRGNFVPLALSPTAEDGPSTGARPHRSILRQGKKLHLGLGFLTSQPRQTGEEVAHRGVGGIRFAGRKGETQGAGNLSPRQSALSPKHLPGQRIGDRFVQLFENRFGTGRGARRQFRAHQQQPDFGMICLVREERPEDGAGRLVKPCSQGTARPFEGRCGTRKIPGSDRSKGSGNDRRAMGWEWHGHKP